MTNKTIEAYALGSCICALATHSKSNGAMLQVMNMGCGVAICGEHALMELRKAIDYALHGAEAAAELAKQEKS